MKSLLSVIAILFIVNGKLHSQVVDWKWAKAATGTGLQESYSIGTDSSGNVYITGNFQHSITFGSTTVTSLGLLGVFIVKFDRYGNLLWARSASGNGSLAVYDISVDAAGNAYIAGRTGLQIIIGQDTLTNNSGSLYQAFLAKYDPAGNVVWTKQVGVNSNDHFWGIHADNSGNLWTIGMFESDSIVLDSHVLYLVPGQSTNVVIAKYDSSGVAQWVSRGSGNGINFGMFTTSDRSGNSYYTGFSTSDTLVFGTDTLFNRSTNYYDIFFVKYNAAGSVVWAKDIGGTDDDYGYGLATDTADNVYLCGALRSPLSVLNTDTIINYTNSEIYFLAKYDSAGGLIWLRTDSAHYGAGYTIAIDKQNNVYLQGYFNDSLHLDTITVQRPAIAYDASFIAKFTSSGNVLWSKVLGSGGDDQAGLAVGISGDIFVGGDFEMVNPFIIGNDSFPLTGNENCFLAKLGSRDGSTEVIEIPTEHDIVLFPNPATERINIIASAEIPVSSISVTDITGRECFLQTIVKQAHGRCFIEMDSAGLKSGVYIVSLQTEKGKLVKKFIRE